MPAFAHSTFVRETQSLKNYQYESKSKTSNVTENLDGYLSFHHFVFVRVWSTVVGITIVSAYVYPYHFSGALDGVHWSATRRLSYSPDLKKRCFKINWLLS